MSETPVKNLADCRPIWMNNYKFNSIVCYSIHWHGTIPNYKCSSNNTIYRIWVNFDCLCSPQFPHLLDANDNPNTAVTTKRYWKFVGAPRAQLSISRANVHAFLVLTRRPSWSMRLLGFSFGLCHNDFEKETQLLAAVAMNKRLNWSEVHSRHTCVIIRHSGALLQRPHVVRHVWFISGCIINKLRPCLLGYN